MLCILQVPHESIEDVDELIRSELDAVDAEEKLIKDELSLFAAEARASASSTACRSESHFIIPETPSGECEPSVQY